MQKVEIRQIYQRDGVLYLVSSTSEKGGEVTAWLVALYNDAGHWRLTNNVLTVSNFSDFRYVKDADTELLEDARRKLYLFETTINASPTEFFQEAVKMKHHGKISSEIGIKHDSDKVRPQLLFKSLNRAVMGVLAVLEYGAKKYAPDNWKKLDDIEERYYNALTRHYLAIQSGETHDSESGLPHIDHLLCSALFISEWQKTNG